MINKLIMCFYTLNLQDFTGILPMNYFTQPQLFISNKAKQLGLQLIRELYIQRTARLAFYLDVNPSFDGHEAVLFWTEAYLANHPEATFSDLQQQFIDSVPQC